MRFSRLCVTAALLALASPATAEKKAAKGCELEPQYDAVVSAFNKLGESFKERGKVILAQKPISRDDVILMNAYRDVHVALAALLIEILNRLGPNCLPEGLSDKMIANAKEAAQTERLPLPPPKPGDGSALPSNVAPSTKSADPVSPPVGVASDPVVKTMDAIDFLVDGKEMVGKRVTVTGCSIQVVANLVTCQVPVGFFGWIGTP
jgi:hypothetical protein